MNGGGLEINRTVGNKFKTMTKKDVKRITELKDRYKYLYNKRGTAYRIEAEKIQRELFSKYDLII